MKTLGFEKNIFKFFPLKIQETLQKIDPLSASSIEEIRLRAGKPLMLQNSMGDFFVNTYGNLEKRNSCNSLNIYSEDILKTLEYMSQNSIYAFIEDIKNGFMTLNGGHRIGICGRIVIENNSVKNIKDISGLNVRISRQIIGCSKKIMPSIIQNGNEICNTLIISPPACGKTTILRDIIRQISDGIEELGFKGQKVGVVDERSEIAACFKGVPQNNVGVRTDILDGCPKALGISMLLRSMSPHVIVTDEIGNSGDKEAIFNIVNAGVKIIASAHGYNVSELKTRKEVVNLIEKGIFDRFVVLSKKNGSGTLEEIIDGKTMKCLYRRLCDAS